jgi:hypothetical protein
VEHHPAHSFDGRAFIFLKNVRTLIYAGDKFRCDSLR